MGSKWITKATHLPELYSLESTISVTAFIGSHPMQNNMRVERQETGHDSKNKMKDNITNSNLRGRKTYTRKLEIVRRFIGYVATSCNTFIFQMKTDLTISRSSPRSWR